MSVLILGNKRILLRGIKRYELTSDELYHRNDNEEERFLFFWLMNEDEPGKTMAGLKVYRFASNIEGDYLINFVKRDSEDKTNLVTGGYTNALAGAKFSVTQKINSVEPGTTSTVTTTQGAVTPLSSERIKIDNTTEKDIYRITETEAPSGYITNGGTIQLDVVKTIKDNKYVLDNICVTAGSGENTVIKHIYPNGTRDGSEERPGVIQIAADGSYTFKEEFVDTKYFIAVDMTDTTINVTWKDKKIEGDYLINFVKRDSEDKTDLVNGGYENALAGAKFDVLQRINCVDPGTTSTVTTTQGAVTPLSSERIKIDNIAEQDIFRITETGAPEGYLLNGRTIQLNVHKEIKDNKYVLKHVCITFGSGETRIIKDIFPDGTVDGSEEHPRVIQIAADGTYTLKEGFVDTKYFIAVDMTDTTINVTWKDTKLEGSFYLDLVKCIKGETTPLKDAAKLDNEPRIAPLA